jgi:hypothetical protein
MSRQGFSALALNDPNGFLGGGQVDVSTKHPRAFACKRDRRCLAVAPAGANRPGADNKCYLAFEPINNVSGPIGLNNNTIPHQHGWGCRTPEQRS